MNNKVLSYCKESQSRNRFSIQMESHTAVNLQQKGILTRRCASLDQEDKASASQHVKHAAKTVTIDCDRFGGVFHVLIVSANLVQPRSAKTFFLSL